jgi:hypothetical protein
MPNVNDKPSYREQVAALDVGESFFIGRKVRLKEATPEVLQDWAARLNNTARSAVARARLGDTSKTDFSVETLHTMTNQKDVVVMAMITRY